MLQHAKVQMLGVVGSIKKLNAKGTNISVYVNYIDDYGNNIGHSLFHCTLFNDAEKVFVRSNAKVGDQIMIVVGNMTMKKLKDSETGVDYFSPSIVLNYGSQILIVCRENHQMLANRNNAQDHYNDDLNIQQRGSQNRSPNFPPSESMYPSYNNR